MSVTTKECLCASVLLVLDQVHPPITSHDMDHDEDGIDDHDEGGIDDQFHHDDL